ncbi:MAG: PQQ-binding-like beta-propeller repeat protein [Eubacterium sp.]|nr:PQQ-binding-like beta-propeller repeat protein [Eubacterium sp.]
MKKRLFVFLLSLFVLLMMAASVSAAEEGYFVLTVCTANSVVVRPERIYYTEGQSVKEALLASGHEFTGLEERDFIDAVDGVAANYTMLYDNGGYSLEIPASEISALRFGVTDVSADYQEEMFSLIYLMAEYSDMDNHVQNYPDAQEAYKLCLNAIRGNGSSAATMKRNLEQKIAEYEAVLNGPKYSVSVTATQDGAPLNHLNLRMVDSYGNETTAEGNVINVIAGDYSFAVSDGGYNRTEGTITVSENTSLQVLLPTGEWFGEMYMRSYNVLMGYSEPYESVQDKEQHKTTFYVDDTADGYYGTNLVVTVGDLPDSTTTKLRTIYISVDGRDFSNSDRSWSNGSSSYGNFLDSLVRQGMEGRSFRIEGQYPDENGHLQIQSYNIEVIRVPTLQSLVVMADGSRLSLGNQGYTQSGRLLPIDYVTDTMELSLTTVSDTLDITAVPFDESYAVTGLGHIAVNDGASEHEVVVIAPNGIESTYHIQITKTDAVPVSLIIPENVTVEVTTNMGAKVEPVDGIYYLVPGETYTYTATKGKYYHSTAPFTAEQGLTVSVADPVMENWLTGFCIYNGLAYQSENIIDPSVVFQPTVHEYHYTLSDMTTALYFKASKEKGAVYVQYPVQASAGTQIYGDIKKIEITSVLGEQTITNGASILAQGGYSNQFTISVEYEENGVTYSQEYYFIVDRKLHILELTARSKEESLTWLDDNGNPVEFDRDISNYKVLIDRDATEIVLNGQVPGNYSAFEMYRGGYICTENGNHYNSYVEQVPLLGTRVFLEEMHLPLDTGLEQEEFKLELTHVDPGSVKTEYTITVLKTEPVNVTVQTEPGNVIFVITNDINGKRVFPENGVYPLTAGGSYTYTATCYGYIGKREQYTVPDMDAVLSITLEKAAEYSGIVEVPSLWPQLRQNNDNNGVINYPVPIKADDTVVYWAKRYGEGYSDGAVSPPILVDGNLIVYSGNHLYKIDDATGDILNTGTMETVSSFAINPPTYANGMIFVGLRNGTIQAFNASTLESLWVYHDPLGGQPNCTITYQNGYIYTGFWVGENSEANFVCLSTTDEDLSSGVEEKLPVWTHKTLGGFYWAGAYVCDNFVLIGTDDGDLSYDRGLPLLLSLDPETGAVISSQKLSVAGDIRSSITHYNGKYYFTNKGGYFMEASVDESGTIVGIRYLNLGGMSTSTPVVYNNRAYIGVCGKGQFRADSGHGIVVVDLANWEIAYSATTRGYPQTSGILTTAYEEETGKVYVYFFENFTPGKLRILEDAPGQTEPSLITIENEKDFAYNLFEPVGEHAQFAICSPIADTNGTIYFKNDSAYLMAVGSTIEELEVVQNPAKMTYQEGEIFDGTGLKVTAHFSNGTSRDVTQYMKWSEEPLSAEDTDFALEYPIVLYQNVEQEDGSMLTGVEVTPPIATLSLQIESETSVKYGDVNEDGAVDLKDVNAVFRIVSGNVAATDSQKAAGDVNGDGYVDLKDLNLIFKKVSGQIAVFPVEETS